MFSQDVSVCLTESLHGESCQEGVQCSHMLTGAVCSSNQCTCRQGLTYLQGRCRTLAPLHSECQVVSERGTYSANVFHLITLYSSRTRNAPLASTVSLRSATRASVNVPMDSTSGPRTFVAAFCLVSYKRSVICYKVVIIVFSDPQMPVTCAQSTQIAKDSVPTTGAITSSASLRMRRVNRK